MYTYNVKWYSSILEISHCDWDKIFSTHNAIKRYELIKAIEFSKLQGVCHYYLEIKDKNDIVAIIPCFIYDFDIAVISGDKLKKSVKICRSLFSRFLFSRIFFVGTPLSVCDHLFGISRTVKGFEISNLFNIIKAEIKKKAEICKCSFTIIKEIPSSERLFFDKHLLSDYCCVNSLPNSFMPVIKNLKFPDYLRSRYKKNIRRKIRTFNEYNFTWEKIVDYTTISKTLYLLYMQTFEKSKNKFEKLNQDFFQNLELLCKDNSMVYILKDEQNHTIAMIIFIYDHKNLVPLYLGIDYNNYEDAEVYYNCIYKIIKIAQDNNFEFIKLGQTSYTAKLFSGAFFEELYIYVFHSCNIVRFMLRHFSKHMFPKTKIDHINCYIKNLIENLEN